MAYASESLASEQATARRLHTNDASPMLPQRKLQENQQPEQPERQEFRNSHVALGVATHLIRTAGALSPFLILEFVKEPTRAHRWIKIASIATAGLNETLWATRVHRSSQENRHR